MTRPSKRLSSRCSASQSPHEPSAQLPLQPHDQIAAVDGARDDEHLYRSTTGGRKPSPRQLHEVEVHVGKRLLAGGRFGIVESIAWSAATESKLYVVAHDSRIRLTYRIQELTEAPASGGLT